MHHGVTCRLIIIITHFFLLHDLVMDVPFFSLVIIKNMDLSLMYHFVITCVHRVGLSILVPSLIVCAATTGMPNNNNHHHQQNEHPSLILRNIHTHTSGHSEPSSGSQGT